MVSAVAAGVAFTANPLTGQRGEVVLSTVRGLGEPLAGVSASGQADDRPGGPRSSGRLRGPDCGPATSVIGHPASAGRATGAVRIVEGPADLASFANGEVLVAKATAPAWTPLFARAVAVVTDGGTLAAHASLVAREYGIPAVVGTGDATSRLHTGQRVTVDGNAGTVQLADSHRRSR